MKYTQELHDRVRQNLRMFDYPRFDDGDIEALLDEIDRLAAEVERHRWIPVSDMSKLEDGVCYQILTKENPFFPDCEFYSFADGWATDNEVTHYREITLPEP